MTWPHCCDEAGVALLAGIPFGLRVPDEGQRIRCSYAASNEAISKGAARVADCIHYSAMAKMTARWQSSAWEGRSAGIGPARLHGRFKSSCGLGNF